MAADEPLAAPMTEPTRTIEAPALAHGWVVTRFFKQLAKQTLAHDIDDAAALLAYYTVLAAFPMIVFVVTLAAVVVPAQVLIDGAHMATQTLPYAVGQLVEDRVAALTKSNATGFAILGAVFALWGASRGAIALMKALNRLHDKQETRSWVRRQLTAIGCTLGVALLVVTSLALLVAGPAIGHWLSDRFGLGPTFDTGWTIGRWVGAGALVMMVWAVAYRFLPNTRAPFRIFTPGAFIGVLLWLGISRLFGFYLTHWGRYDVMYGAIGGAIILLTWIWLTNLSLLLGAEINDVLADFRAHRSPAAAQLAQETHVPGKDAAKTS